MSTGTQTRLEAFRLVQGLAQTALARTSGVSQAVISEIESGRLPLDEDRSRVLTEVLGHAVDGNVPAVQPLHRIQRTVSAKASRRTRAALALRHLELRDSRIRDDLGVRQRDGYELASDRARTLRGSWGVGRGPVGNFRRLLEYHGIACITFDLDPLRISALGSWASDEHPITLV